MGIFDRFGRNDGARGRTYEGQPIEPSEDEQALARYRYMLRTAPPEAIEQAHAEAFEKLTPQQRRMLLEQLLAEAPESERRYAADNPQALARMATRAEVREPGVMERMFSRMPAAGPGAAGPGATGPGFGGIMASSLLGSVAGTVLGSVIAQSFLGHHGMDLGHGHGADRLLDGDRANDAQQVSDAGADYSDLSAPLDDFGSGFDGGSIDV
jgi:hypothetical protein